VAGLLMESLGRVPVAGDAVTVGDVELRVERVRRHSVETVLARPVSGTGRDAPEDTR
jgi:CBS domain containing-hemolysin-like protein